MLVGVTACGSSATSNTSTPQPFAAPTQTSVARLSRAASPHRPVPAGWKIYRGGRVPFVIAYPPGWTVDAADAPVGSISFLHNAGERSMSGIIGVSGTPNHANLTVLRGRFLSLTTRICELGRKIVGTGVIVASGIRFDTAAAHCAAEESKRAGEANNATGIYLGVGLRQNVEWTFEFTSSSSSLPANGRRYFVPMLHTLNIFANP
jgi:hypothetical protein